MEKATMAAGRCIPVLLAIFQPKAILEMARLGREFAIPPSKKSRRDHRSLETFQIHLNHPWACRHFGVRRQVIESQSTVMPAHSKLPPFKNPYDPPWPTWKVARWLPGVEPAIPPENRPKTPRTLSRFATFRR